MGSHGRIMALNCVTNQWVENVLCHFSVCRLMACRNGTSRMEAPITSEMELWSASQLSGIWTLSAMCYEGEDAYTDTQNRHKETEAYTLRILLTFSLYLIFSSLFFVLTSLSLSPFCFFSLSAGCSISNLDCDRDLMNFKVMVLIVWGGWIQMEKLKRGTPVMEYVDLFFWVLWFYKILMLLKIRNSLSNSIINVFKAMTVHWPSNTD